ncbi:MAG: betaine-aldehyde dehydrogenase [Gammaproteobacteria bacterium]|nr:betaine-aldehyde dehydrogenase [Gammaproteobacteria bacterium]
MTLPHDSGNLPHVRVREFLGKPLQLLIDGRWLPAASGETFEVRNPATGDVIGTAAAGAAEDIDRAVAAARRAFASPGWRTMRPADRRLLLWKLADALEAHAEELSLLETLDNGMPRMAADFFCRIVAVETLRYNAGWVGKVNGETPEVAAADQHVYTLKEPIGVVGAILPWNGPLGMVAARIAPAIAAGCTLVLKPAELTPLTALRVGELALEVGFPPGVLNIVTGFGHTAGRALSEHPDVDKISFTGSTAVGRQIVRAAAGNLKRVSLELGGKSPVIVLPDADLERAIESAASGIFWNSGQICVAGSRLYAHKAIFDRVVAGVIERARSLKVGSGLEPGTQIGPLISAQHLERVSGYIRSGLEEGAELVTGGKRIGTQGYFVEPTVLSRTHASMRVVREEIFGPVLCAMPIEEEDLLAIASVANDTDYGLSAYVWTRDISVAHKLARAIRSGSIRINGGTDLDPALPFGGVKQSGWGRENGREGVEMYLETKSVSIRL